MNRQGQCLCGNVRFATSGEPMVSAFCHCPSCRRASGAPVVAWAMFKRDQVTFAGAEPKVNESSPGVRRGFCADCGTPVSFEADYIPGLIDLTVESFDSPAGLEPQMHIWHGKARGWLLDAAQLPTHDELPPGAG